MKSSDQLSAISLQLLAPAGEQMCVAQGLKSPGNERGDCRFRSASRWGAMTVAQGFNPGCGERNLPRPEGRDETTKET